MTGFEVIVEHLDWPALALGLVGTALWVHNGRLAKQAAAWWLSSSLLWVVYAYLNGLPALGVRDLVSIALYSYGGYRWLLADRARRKSLDTASRLLDSRAQFQTGSRPRYEFLDRQEQA